MDDRWMYYLGRFSRISVVDHFLISTEEILLDKKE
jgi:hypothetical protein